MQLQKFLLPSIVSLFFATFFMGCVALSNESESKYNSVKENYKYYVPKYNDNGQYIGAPIKGLSKPNKTEEIALSDGSTMRNSKAIQRATMKPYKVAGKWYYPERIEVGETMEGIASWYGPNFHGQKTSNGEIYSMYARTAAHKTLPMNTIVKVLNLENGKATIVRINDRGPFVEKRIIDLSNTAAREIDMVKKGTAHVRLTILGFAGTISKEYKKNVEKMTIDKDVKIGNSAKSMNLAGFMIQIGAFRNKEGATAYKQTYGKDKNYTTVIREFSYKKKPLYRVFISGFKSEKEAKDYRTKKNLKGAFVITDSGTKK